MLAKAVEKAKEAYPEQTGDDMKKILTSNDGGWQKCGHVSKSGLRCVDEQRTGLSHHHHVLSTVLCDRRNNETR